MKSKKFILISGILTILDGLLMIIGFPLPTRLGKMVNNPETSGILEIGFGILFLLIYFYYKSKENK